MTSLSEETLARARAPATTRRWTCRSAVAWSTTPTSWPTGSRSAGPTGRRDRRVTAMSDRARRPGPTVRTHVRELTETGERRHEDRLATEEPLEIRLAWPGAPARRVWVTMDPGNDFELAAGWLVHEGWRGRETSPPRVLHGRRPEPRAGVQRRHGDAGRPGGRPGHRHTTQATGSSARGLRQGQHRRGAHGEPRRPLVGRAARAGRRTPSARPAARAAASSLEDRRRARGRPVRRGRHAAGRPGGRRAAQRRRQGHRARAGDPPAAACLVVSGRAGFELVQKARPSASGPWSPSGRPRACPSSWPGRAAWRCTASRPRGAASATPERVAAWVRRTVGAPF